jgi:peptide/nickel transport system substrate-binding protein
MLKAVLKLLGLTWFRRYGSLIGLALVAAIALTACNPRDFRTRATQVPQLVVSTLGDPKTFNYALNQEFPNVFIFMYEGLVDQNGVTGDVIPALAESWDIAEDKRHITFTLRPGLKWSDGQPLTADDVVFTFNDIYLNEKIPTDERDGLRIGDQGLLPTVRKVDDRRVEFTLPEPFAPILRSVGSPILPAHILCETINSKDAQGNLKFLSTWGTDTNPTTVVGNGPYVMENYVTSQRVVFRRNPHYWRRDAQGNQQPYIERIIWKLVESTDTQMLKFRSGELDSVGLLPEDFSLLKREAKRGRFTIHEGGPRSGTNFISFNLNQAKNSRGQPVVDPVKSRWFNNKSFRQAVAYALDRQKMINNTFRGLGALQNSPVSVQSPFYLSPEEGLKVYEYNPEKAKALLQSAGFRYDSQGRLFDGDGNRVRFSLITNVEAKVRVTLATQVKQDLDAIGMQVDFNPISFNTLIEKLSTSRDWDCYLLGFTGGVEPHNGSNVWKSTGGLHTFNLGPQPGQPPITNWVVSDWEKEIDRLFIQGTRELDETKRKAIYARFQEITQEQLPSIYLINSIALSAIRDRVQGIQFTGLDPRGSLWNLYDLKVVEK